MDDDDLAAAATAIDPGSPPPVQELAASAPALPVDNAASTAGETLAVDPPTAAAAGDGEQVPFDEEKVHVPAEAIPQETDSTSADEQVPVAAEAVLEEAASAAVDEAHEDEDPVRGDANPASEGGVAKGDSRDGGAYISLVSLGVGGDVGAEIDDLVGEGTGIPDAVEAMPTTPDIVLDADGDGEALDGEGDKSDEYAKASGDDMVVKELVGVAEDSAPADITKADESDEDAGVGVQLDGINVAMDDSTELGASLVGVDSNMVSNRGGASFDDQTGQEIGGGAHDDADEDDGPRMDKNTPVSDDGEDSQDEQGAQMDVVATTVLSGVEAELVKAGDDVAGEGTNMDTLAPTGDDSEEEGVAMAGVTATDEEVRQMDAVAMTRDGNEEKATGKDGVDATDEDIRVDTIGLTGDDNEEKEVAAAGDDGADEEGMQMDAVTSTGDEDEEDGMAGQNVAEEADSVPEEAEVGTVGNDIPEEEAVQIDDDEEPPPLTRKGGGRRKRGRPSSKAQAVVKPSVKRKDDEEVCFICFDGGDLVVCDRRGCPKAYHPSCVNRDDEFFKSKGRWNCGWHICSNCQKHAHHMCYTCTYSLCKVCIKETKFVCVRRNKGFCETCMNTVMLIENREEATEQMDVDFDDKSSWWYLFKDYWLNLKTKLAMTFEEISAAKSQKNGSSLVIRDNDLSELPDTNDEEEANSDSSSGCHLESNTSKKRGRKRSKHAASKDSSKRKESTRKSTKRGLSGSRDAKDSTGRKVRKLSKRALSSEHRPKESESVGTSTSSAEESSWASKELLDFVAHMRNGDKSVLSQFDVQALLLEYIKRKSLRDPHRKSQIVCDYLLQSLFGKARVGHFEMLKLLESHFIMSEVSPIDIDGNHGGVVDPDPSQDADGNSEASVVMSSEKRKKSRKYDQGALQTNLDDYAAIDNHNISLMYLRRNLIEELIGDVDTFDEKVLGSFVRIRISGTGQRQDIYRLVQIVGTGTAAEKYKCGKKTTDITLEILNLDKREVITIDITSNQEFTEEECKRLRQSIKCGFIPRLTVGEVQEKARVLQAVKVNDWIESEKMRLGHLRDRASDMGHRKELRECVEKLQLLSTPEERARRLSEEPEIHADPTMDPDYESPEEQEQDTERSSFNKSRGSFFRKDSNPVSPGKGEGRNAAQRDSKTNWESNRNTWGESITQIESPLGRRSTFSPHGESSGYTGKSESPNVGAQVVKMEATTGNTPRGLSGISSETLAANVGSGATPASQSSINESEKIWQYIDPSGKVQGPFSIVQLRKWNSSGYFPPSLKIWKSSEKQDDSILLTDALVGKFEKDLPPWEPPLGSSSLIDKTYLGSNSHVGSRPSSDSLLEECTKAGEQTSKSAVPNRSQSFSGRVGQRHDYDTTNLGSTMIQSGAQGYYGMQNSQAAFAAQQSLTGSWNASSSQFGTTVNPMTLSQPPMGGFSVGQNNAVAGNVGQLTPVPGPAAVNAEIVNSQLLSQNQIASVLPERVDRLADRNDLKLGEDASHGRMRSSGEDLGPVGAQPGAAQANTQQLEAPADARNQLSTDASNSMMPSQLMSTPSAEPVQPSATAVTGGDSQISGWAMPAQVANTSGQAQGAGNLNWGAALQGNASMGWGMMGQTNMNMSWGAPAQGAASYSMGLTMPQPNAVPNMGWVTLNPGNTNMNMIWAATQGQGTQNAATMMGAQMQGVAMAPWGTIAQGNANSYPGWGTQVGNMNQNIGWGSPMQGNPGPNPGNGSGQGNNNMNWNSPSGNPNRDTGGRHSAHGDDFNGGDSGGRSWRSQSGGDGGSWGHRRAGVCWSFVDTGICRKGEQCHYYHPQTNDGYPSRNDRHFDRQTSSNERRYDRHNGRNDRQFDRQPSDRQFDRQPSGNERHYDRHDDRHSDRDNDRNDDRQADRSESRERW